MSVVLTFDVGKTSCDAAVFVDGVCVASGSAGGARGVADAGGVDAAIRAMVGAASAAGVDRGDAVGAGLAGLATAPRAAASLAGALEDRFGARAVTLASDVVTAHAGALAGGAGVVVVAGTGSVALGVAADGTTARADGYGYLLGDVGGGYSIGRAGLDSALRYNDGRSGSATLAQLARERFGPLDELPATVLAAPEPAKVIASFAPSVCAAAADGDLVAQRICSAAGTELARSAAAVASRLDLHGAPVALTGGLSKIPALTSAFEREIAVAELPVRRRVGDALDGAYLLATEADLPHEKLVTRSTVGAR